MGRTSVLVCMLCAALLAACVPLPAAETPNPTAIPPVSPPPTPVEAAAVIAASEPTTLSDLASPDGRWRAVVLAYPCVPVDGVQMAYEELRLVSGASGNGTLAAHQLRNCEGLGAIGLDGLSWSADSRYFYFTDAREGVPDGGCGPFYRPMLRLDTATFAVQPLGSGPRSPDGARLAAWQDGALVIWNLQTGDAQRLAPVLPAVPTIIFAWSPDGQSLVYLHTENACPPSGRARIARADLPDMAQSIVLDTAELEDSPHLILDLQWDTADTLRIVGAAGEEWRLDLTTGDLRAQE